MKGDSNLGVLVQSSGLTGKAVREALFVLIHHSIVSYSANSSSSSSSNHTIYHLNLDSILERVAYGQVVARVAEKFSVEAADLLLEIMVAGRMKIDLNSANENEELECLFKEGIVEIVTPDMSQFSTESSSSILVASEKRKLDQETLFSTTSNSNKKKSKLAANANQSESDDFVFVRFKAKETIFKFVFTEKLVDNVTRRLNRSAGIIIEAILNLNEDSSQSLITFTTFQLTQKLPKDIDFPMESTSNSGLSASPLLQYLQVLAQNFDFIQAQISLGASTFSLDIKKALRHLRLSLIESFIRARLGVPSARIFKILLSKRMFEERQIAKVAMITSKEVRERLYALLKLGLVHLQEVPKSIDHAPSRTIFLWSVPERANFSNPSKSALFRNFASKLLTGLVNLRDLIALERKKHAQLLEKVERSDVANNLDLLSPIEQKQLMDLKKILKVLNVKIDQIFNEFLIFHE